MAAYTLLFHSLLNKCAKPRQKNKNFIKATLNIRSNNEPIRNRIESNNYTHISLQNRQKPPTVSASYKLVPYRLGQAQLFNCELDAIDVTTRETTTMRTNVPKSTDKDWR